MNPAPECSPAHGKPSSPAMGGNWGQRQANSPLAPFPFQLKTPLRLSRSGLREIIFRARCWWLIQRIALKMWWRG
jgi:hypothetical protein